MSLRSFDNKSMENGESSHGKRSQETQPLIHKRYMTKMENSTSFTAMPKLKSVAVQKQGHPWQLCNNESMNKKTDYIFKENDEVLLRSPCYQKHTGVFIMEWKGPYVINSISYGNLCTLKSGKRILKTNIHVGDLILAKEKSRDIENYEQKVDFFVDQEQECSTLVGSVEKKNENSNSDLFNQNLFENNRRLNKGVDGIKDGQRKENIKDGVSENTIVLSDNNDVIFVNWHVPHEDRLFNPVDQYWQIRKCQKFKLQLVNCLNFVENKILTEPTIIRRIIGDGNCMYRAICFWVTGSEDDHFRLRQLITKFAINNDAVRNYLGDNVNPEAGRIGTWGTSDELFAASVLLDTSIYVYSTISKSWHFFNKYLDMVPRSAVETEKFIYLRNVENRHYDVVLDVKTVNA